MPRAWMVRHGRNGEYESIALDNGLAVIGWEDIGDLSTATDRAELQRWVRQTYPKASARRVANHAGQLWAFAHIKAGDIVVLPLKNQPLLAIGRVREGYRYRDDLVEGARHTLGVDWARIDLPRETIGQDLRNSLGSILTVCELRRNNAVARVEELMRSGTDPDARAAEERDASATDEDAGEEHLDLEEAAHRRIRERISARFAGHDLAQLVAAIFQAQGMHTFVSPAGPDGGVDVLCGGGPLGMDEPRIAVQVKFTSAPADVRVLRELQGVAKNLGASQLLVVSWNGLTREAEREARGQFFTTRVWTSHDVLRELTEVYDRLPEEIQADLPLKRVWVLADGEDD